MVVLNLVDGEPPKDCIDDEADFVAKEGSVSWGLQAELDGLEKEPPAWEKALAIRLAKIIDQSNKVPASLVVEYQALVKTFSADEIKKDPLGLDLDD